MVESYQEAAAAAAAAATDEAEKVQKIVVRVGREVNDKTYSIGKVVTNDFLPGFVKEATKGDKGTVVVIFTARDVTVQGLCMGKCADHGVIGNLTTSILSRKTMLCYRVKRHQVV